MAGHEIELVGPDFAEGVALSTLPDDAPVLGHAHGEAVVLVRHGGAVHAVGASCTHYGGPLAEGLVAGGTIRCPWHHARFDLTTGEAVCAPALSPIARWHVAIDNGRVRVTARAEAAPPRPAPEDAPESVVILGAGAAAAAAADALRREGYEGDITIVGEEADAPTDRPNLSKDFLAGSAPEEWLPLRPAEQWAEAGVELVVGVRATAVDTKARRVELDDGRSLSYGALLIATGARPRRLTIPGADGPSVFYLRSLADCRKIIAKAEGAKHVAVVGASFIGLEVAASLRTRGLEVHVVAPEERPLERVLGSRIGDFVRSLHEDKGVVFHLGRKPRNVEESHLVLDDGEPLRADLVVVGIGVEPATEVATAAGIEVDNGIVVDAHLRTSAEGVWAAGDVARYPDPRTGELMRVEHWVHAERMGQAAARDMVGRGSPFRAPPFFWSQHYDVPICYVGHCPTWDRLDEDGEIMAGDFTAVLRRGGRPMAVVTAGRDHVSLHAEDAMERGDDPALDALARRE